MFDRSVTLIDWFYGDLLISLLHFLLILIKNYPHTKFQYIKYKIFRIFIKNRHYQTLANYFNINSKLLQWACAIIKWNIFRSRRASNVASNYDNNRISIETKSIRFDGKIVHDAFAKANNGIVWKTIKTESIHVCKRHLETRKREKMSQITLRTFHMT